MQIEIHRPELEALIQEQLKSGAFRDVEDVLMHALTVAAAAAGNEMTGASLVAAMQACPVKDFNFEQQPTPMPVRDVTF